MLKPDELIISARDQEIIDRSMPYTMTPVECVFCLIQAIDHIVEQEIVGDFVECGVWKGGSVIAAALTFLRAEDASRTLYLFDTFEGMSPPTEDDIDIDGIAAATHLTNQPKNTDNHFWAYAPLELVKSNVLATGYPVDKFRFVKGKVEETIPETMPEQIALLRLDTDWYESTIHELVHLYPRLSSGGILVIDDYGFWKGSRKAVDEYFSKLENPPQLNKINEVSRYCVKP